MNQDVVCGLSHEEEEGVNEASGLKNLRESPIPRSNQNRAIKFNGNFGSRLFLSLSLLALLCCCRWKIQHIDSSIPEMGQVSTTTLCWSPLELLFCTIIIMTLYYCHRCCTAKKKKIKEEKHAIWSTLCGGCQCFYSSNMPAELYLYI